MCNQLWIVDCDSDYEGFIWFLGPKASYDAHGFEGHNTRLLCHALEDAEDELLRQRVTADPWVDIPF